MLELELLLVEDELLGEGVALVDDEEEAVELELLLPLVEEVLGLLYAANVEELDELVLLLLLVEEVLGLLYAVNDEELDELVLLLLLLLLIVEEELVGGE